MLKNENIQDLINYIEEGQKKINSAKKKLVESTNDFEIWLKYCEDKTKYSFILGSDTPLMKLLHKHCVEIFYSRYYELDIWCVLSISDNLLKEGFITKDEVEELKDYLHKINFGSMKIDW